MESVKPFLALPQAEELANLSTTRTHLKPIHFAVEVKNLDVVRLLVPLTAEYKGRSAEEVMATVQKQFDAEKAKSQPAAKPKTQLSAYERRVCDKKLREAKAAMAAHDYQRAADLLSDAIAINPLSEKWAARRSENQLVCASVQRAARVGALEGGRAGRQEGRRAQSRVGQGAPLPGERVLQAGTVCGRGHDVLPRMRIGAREQGAVDEVPGSTGGGEEGEPEGVDGGEGARAALRGFHLFVRKVTSLEMSTSSAFLIDPEGSVVTTLGKT